MKRALLAFALCPLLAGADPYPWPRGAEGGTFRERFAPPPGAVRVEPAADSFGAWLQRLPLKPGRPPVRLYDGALKANQEAHLAVVDIPVGRQDLQQCADAVIRLRAEYLFSAGRAEDVCFRFTNGDPAPWSRWAAGDRPTALGSKVVWVRRARPDGSRSSFEKYLFTLYRWAGSLSLSRELRPVSPGSPLEIGDVFIQGGSPGHAVLAVDAARGADGRRYVALVQSYMPAQEIHVLKNPTDGSPWFSDSLGGPMATPEWDFPAGALKRFHERGCP